jgi:site-specific recombinase XerD
VKRPPEIYTADEVRALIDACQRRGTGLRNRALLALLYRSGVRISEALALDYPRDVQVMEHRGQEIAALRVRHGKGDRHRTVAIDNGALDILRAWIAERSKWGIEDGPLFATKDKTRMSASQVRHLLPRLARDAEIHKRVHAHGFRHTAAFELAVEGVPPHAIKKVLGHSSLAVTDRYLDHVGATVALDVIADRAPFNGATDQKGE